MRTGRYSISELFSNRYIERLVIPEIQRDYVWKDKNVGHLLTSILENFNTWQNEKREPSLKVVASVPESGVRFGEVELQSLEREFATFHARRTCATNIGFIYAYCDGDLAGQYFLIDGQQRLTTLYLTLLAVAVSKEELKERFRTRYCFPPDATNRSAAPVPTKLDYRLREHTVEFLHRFVQYILDHGGTAEQLNEQSWYLRRFDGDITIKNLHGNFDVIRARLEKEMSPDKATALFEYLEDLVECWYFDTNESAQGEELYLYLNARGESIADNENLKAELLEKVGDGATKDCWGRKWEEWQDYFWQKRSQGLPDKVANPNADRGFNSFLSCIDNLEKLRNKGRAPGLLELETINRYLEALRWLEKERKPFKTLYSYADWVELWFSDMWRIFNKPDATEWAAKLDDNNKSTAHNHMVLVWGSLLSVVCASEDKNCECSELDPEAIFRAIRFFYLRYHNFRRAVASLPETVRGILVENPEVLARGEETNEEREKWDFFKACPVKERRELEAVIWKIEDHPLNLDGRDLGGVNLTHLVDLGQKPSLSKLECVRDTFYGIFDSNKCDTGKADDDEKKVAAALLYFGAFWHQASPWYYENYNLGDWRRTIRGQGNKDKRITGNGTVFRVFFEEYQKAGQSLDVFLEQKKGSVPVNPANELELSNALIWYSERIGKRLFEEGMYVAKEMTKENGADAHFPNIPIIWNTQGNFRGNYNKKLADLVEKG